MPGNTLTYADLVEVYKRFRRPPGRVVVHWACGNVAFEAPEESVRRFEAAGFVTFEHDTFEHDTDDAAGPRGHWYVTLRGEHELGMRGIKDEHDYLNGLC